MLNMPTKRSRTLKTNWRNQREAVIFDIDGVLADNQLLYDAFKEMHGVVDWTPEIAAAWFAERAQDRAHQGWQVLAQMLWVSGYTIVILTSRNEGRREMTEEWLARHQIYWDELLMCDYTANDYHSHKREAIAALVKRYHIHLAIDDEGKHIEAYDDFDVTTIHFRTVA